MVELVNSSPEEVEDLLFKPQDVMASCTSALEKPRGTIFVAQNPYEG